ncbi:MAG TPA: sialate O-acetylesterase [Phycisphaerales bacterium]|nr:sialate O-acetylesterase [Phycisphaerales bacterium]
MRCAITALMLAASTAAADVALPAILGSNMVLQADTAAPIWGWAAPGERITVTPDWPGAEPVAVSAGDDGAWRAELRTPNAGGPHTITIAGSTVLTLDNVLIGEVWLASGQSNMEWPLRLTDNAEREIAAADHPDIRLFIVENTVAASPQSDCRGRWVVCSPQTAADFGAVAYYFGRELHGALSTPVGLIASEWGGTPAESWTSAEPLAAFPRHAPGLELMRLLREDPQAIEREHQAALADWKAKYETAEARTWPTPAHSDADWGAIAQPSNWSSSELATFDGTVWCRKTVEIPAEWAGKELTLSLGPIDDNDTTHFNGVQIGETRGWDTPRRYTVPAELVRAGPAVVAVSVLDTGGRGGMHGEAVEMFLAPAGHGDGRRLSLAGDWKYKAVPGGPGIPPQPRPRSMNAHTPSALYNGMIAPLVPYAIRGAIWYQGESNRHAAYEYRTLFPAMITDWRKQWGTDFPFYFVQIAPFTYDGDRGETAELREAQLLTLDLPGTGMAVTMDIGNPRDIHPTNKLGVGKRLALWALAKTYARTGLEYSGPLYESVTTEGDTLVLRFAHAEGLHSRGGVPKGFEIAGEDQVWHAAGAIIEGDTVTLSAYGVTNPIAARYGWDDADEPNLFNAAGLPASPFRTDAWKRVTQP